MIQAKPIRTYCVEGIRNSCGFIHEDGSFVSYNIKDMKTVPYWHMRYNTDNYPNAYIGEHDGEQICVFKHAVLGIYPISTYSLGTIEGFNLVGYKKNSIDLYIIKCLYNNNTIKTQVSSSSNLTSPEEIKGDTGIPHARFIKHKFSIRRDYMIAELQDGIYDIIENSTPPIMNKDDENYIMRNMSIRVWNSIIAKGFRYYTLYDNVLIKEDPIHPIIDYRSWQIIKQNLYDEFEKL